MCRGIRTFTFYPKILFMKTPLTIFYADDDVEDLDFFREVIETIDDTINVHTLNDGQELIDILLNPPPTPHMIFLDLNMPGKTGLAVLKEMRGDHGMQAIPVIIFTTSTDSEDILRSRELGANYFVSKQPSYHHFKASIEHALSINWSTFRPSAADFVYRKTA
jgi:CheY-like chemotaxis protein